MHISSQLIYNQQGWIKLCWSEMCLFNLKVPRHAVAAWPYILHVCRECLGMLSNSLLVMPRHMAEEVQVYWIAK